MEKIKVIHDSIAHTLTIWIGNPKKETICEESSEEVIFMKDKNGNIIGVEILNYKSAHLDPSLIVETIVKTAAVT
ncbi:MAG: DUF2283 domain-containing protein [Deltaproteobacteria bacterium]|nr:DUF2283 domain-containing protein [Deltaproteobacteria bacterium]